MKSGERVVMLLLLLVSSSANKSNPSHHCRRSQTKLHDTITLICFPTLHLSLVGL